MAATPASPLSGLSRARLQGLIEAGNITVDGVSGRASKRLRTGAMIGITLPPPAPLEVVPESLALSVLYEDHDLIVIAKPAGMTVHPGAGQQHGTLVAGLLAHCHDLSGIGGVMRPGIVHRLDRGTSGVIVAAKHDRAHVAIARQFAARSVEKLYVAFVIGVPDPAAATIRTFYGRHPIQRKRFTSKLKAGKEAVTSYRVEASGGGVSRLSVRLGTGRTHQIRVHLSDKGYPIVADSTYGGGGRRLASLSAAMRAVAEALPHQALHAAVLSFAHPSSGALLRFEAPLPPDLQALADAMLR